MNKFSRRLKNLRVKNNYSREVLSRKTGVTYSTIAKYESGTREPDFETLESLADVFEVSIDYLLGRSDSGSMNKKEMFIEKIATEFPDADLMFNDLANMSADDLEEVYNYIKFKKSQKDGD